ncbi:MAG: glutathione S-transferase N-terminal domain-containing protein [Xanthomonadales bacterium]|nr:glutathione S-transferase N-terminal domain-containing protein [Xanthomonadales bacterium]
MHIKLFYSPTSPYARKVLVVIKELKLDSEVEMVSVNPLLDNPELIAHNPLAKVPTLVQDNGFVLYDSPLICEYLISIAEEKNLNGLSVFAGEGKDYFSIQKQQALADGVMDATFSLVMERKRKPEQQSEFWKKRWLNSINRGLDEFFKPDHMQTGQLTIGTIAMCCALGYLKFRTPEIKWQENYPELYAWYQEMLQRQSFKETDPNAM